MLYYLELLSPLYLLLESESVVNLPLSQMLRFFIWQFHCSGLHLLRDRGQAGEPRQPGGGEDRGGVHQQGGVQDRQGGGGRGGRPGAGRDLPVPLLPLRQAQAGSPGRVRQADQGVRGGGSGLSALRGEHN